jgi:hypothetical protein
MKVKLEFEKIEILRPKERWRLYFVVVTDHPTETDKMVLSILPDIPIRLKPSQNNIVNFEPEGEDGEITGLTVLERELPNDANTTLKVRTYLRHSRSNVRDAGKVLQDIKTELGTDVFGIASNLLGSTVPWLIIAKGAIELLGGILTKIKDRDFGFVNMDQSFDPQFEYVTELDRSNQFTTGEAKIVWSWSVAE